MDPSWQTWMWLGGGAVLLASELVLPGLVAAFFGAGALTVAGLRAVGLLDGFAESTFAWGALSIAYTVALRGTLTRWFGAGERSRETTDENVRLFGRVVDVVEAIGDGTEARIRFDGTTWPARSNGEPLKAGQKARILHRDNIAWVVEAVLDPTGPTNPELPRIEAPALDAGTPQATKNRTN